jgi:hypothetical protein
VPSRIHPGKFFALPQAPQQYKQLLMVAGFDRYFQIAPCFRDEDPRADRLPGEFYQLDLEMSFVTQEDVWDTMEPVLRGVFEEFGNGKPVTQKFPRIPYDTAIRKYGSDKPDLRNPIEMDNVSEHFRGSGFKVFAGMLEKTPRTRYGHSCAGRREPCVLRQDEFLGAAAGPTGPWLHLLARGRGRRRGAGRQEHRTGAHGGYSPAVRIEGGRRRVLHGGRSEGVLQVRGRGAEPRRRRAWPDAAGPVCLLLDRGLPVL